MWFVCKEVFRFCVRGVRCGEEVGFGGTRMEVV